MVKTDFADLDFGGTRYKTDLHNASWKGDAAAVERLLKQHPDWVHEKDGVRSARVG